MAMKLPTVNCAYDLLVRVEELQPHPRNPNKHPAAQVEMLAKIIQHQGWRSPITVSERSGYVVTGHCRLEAAKFLGLKRVPVDRQKFVSEADELAHLLADNKVAELSELSGAETKALLVELAAGGKIDLDLTGFDGRARENMGVEVLADAPESQIDRAEELRKKWGVNSGDLWMLGEHRLLCGDSTKREDVERVMGGEKADIVLADPPYRTLKIFDDRGRCLKNAHGVAKAKVYGEFDGHITFALPALLDALGGIPKMFVLWGGNYFADCLPITTSWICWDKSFDGQSIYSDFELAWSNLGCPARIFHHRWQGMIRDGEKIERQHPTQKPVELYHWILDKVTSPKIVSELFIGSGSTMVACEQLKRKCWGIEISPAYCAVTIQRMADMGIKPERINV